ncbi:MAG: D-alanyl-D-alanine carboxypeptidase [Actinomycetota bacterium]|nr:D-alanyl-D-alanine carboxypeptidase [Actinomycetota bacterium]
MRLRPPWRLALPAAALVASVALVSVSSAAATGVAWAADPTQADQVAPQGSLGGPLLDGHDVVAPAGTPPLPPVKAASWLVADLDTGEVMAARDPHGRFAPASTLKTLTALTLIPRLDKAATAVASNADTEVDGTRVGLVAGQAYAVPELLTALMVVSANDAAETLASAAGGREVTIGLMNAEAARLQARDTVARTPSGLDAPGQVSSAYDLALIARQAMALPDFAAYVATRNSSIAAPNNQRIEIFSHDKLLLNYPGAIGIKNGYTVAAHASFVGAATRNGHTLVVTLLRAEPTVWHEAAALLDWGFANEDAGRVGWLVSPAPQGAADRAGSSTAPAADRSLGAAGDRQIRAAALHGAASARVATGPSLVGRPVAALPLAIIGVGVLLALLGLRTGVRRRRRPRRQLPPA